MRLEVFDVLCLVEDHVVPLLPLENGMVSHCNFVAGDAHVETVQFGPALPLLLPLLWRSEVSHNFEGWTPTFELYFPVHQDRGGHDDEVRTPDALFYGQMCQQGDSLDGLPEAHLIGQDRIHAPVVECGDPVDTQELILPKRKLDEEGRPDDVVLMEAEVAVLGGFLYVDEDWDFGRLGHLHILQRDLAVAL